jgi:hypothetical protein
MRFASNSVARMDQQRQRHENISIPATAGQWGRSPDRPDDVQNRRIWAPDRDQRSGW